MIEYGGNTSCVEITAGGRTLILDSGTGIRKLGEKLYAKNILDFDLFITHSHWDHIGGLLTLRKSVSGRAPAALATAHVAEGFFYPRPDGRPGVDRESAVALKPEYERAGGTFVVHAKPVQLHPGVWLLGPIPRHYPERNWGGSGIWCRL